MKMLQVAAATGFSRQWISRMATAGYVPGAARTKSGRWRFPNTPEFRDWVAKAGRYTRSRSRQRHLYKDEAEVRNLERQLASIVVAAESRAKKQRVIALQQAISAKRAAISDFMTTSQIAASVKRSQRWVTRLASEIPGASFTKNRHIFLKSDSLASWIKAQRRISDLDRKLIPGDIRFSPYSPSFNALHALTRCQRDIRRALLLDPFGEWHPEAREAFIRNFELLIKGINEAIS